MDMFQEMLLGWGVALPDWLFWMLIVLIVLVVGGFYVFNKKAKQLAVKYDIPFDKVDGMVRMMASLAIRLYVLKKGVEETNKIARIKNIALTIDLMYPNVSSIRLSTLVTELELAIGRKFSGDELVAHKRVVNELQTNIVKELIPVGMHIQDNENDPIINPREIAVWINKGISAVNFVQK